MKVIFIGPTGVNLKDGMEKLADFCRIREGGLEWKRKYAFKDWLAIILQQIFASQLKQVRLHFSSGLFSMTIRAQCLAVKKRITCSITINMVEISHIKYLFTPIASIMLKG